MMFNDIFKETRKKPINQKALPKIIIDIHEKNSLILSELKSNKDLNIEIKHLDIGDFVLGDIVIERKTISDLISSLISKRIASQIENMKRYEKRLLIIEGKIEGIKEDYRINKRVIKGFILSCITKHNLPVIETDDYKESSEIISILAKQQLKNSIPSLHSRIPKTIEEQKKYILEAFPNIGSSKARLLLEKFKTLNNIFNADKSELETILRKNTDYFIELITR